VEHFFRHKAGRRVSVLTSIFGWRNFDLVQDMVQATLLGALESWRVRDTLRRDQIGQRSLGEWAAARLT
jgi:hypothetical protein